MRWTASAMHWLVANTLVSSSASHALPHRHDAKRSAQHVDNGRHASFGRTIIQIVRVWHSSHRAQTTRKSIRRFHRTNPIKLSLPCASSRRFAKREAINTALLLCCLYCVLCANTTHGVAKGIAHNQVKSPHHPTQIASQDESTSELKLKFHETSFNF